MYSAIENQPILINLLQACNTTGWFLTDGINAVHESCNAGNLPLEEYPVLAGNTYKVSYVISAITGGYVQVQSPGSSGAMQTTPNVYVETVSPTSNGFISFYSNASCSITAFNVQLVSSAPGTTIVFAVKNNKWSDFRQFYPDFGWSLYTRTIVGYEGQFYTFENGGGADTNNFFGVQFQSSIKFVEAKNPAIIKDFEALSYQANQLLITSIDGVQSSLGQITTLIDTDFIKQALTSGGLTVTNYNVDGVYSASFLGDKNDEGGVVNGNGMRGNFLIVELVTFDGSQPLTLFSIAVRAKTVFTGPRP